MLNNTNIMKTASQITILTIEPSKSELIYSKRIAFLESKWQDLMSVQDTLSHDEICANEFQSKRQRIGGLYHTLKNKIAKEKSMADVLKAINPNMSNLPLGITIF